MLRVLLVATVVVLCAGCARTVHSELAMYDWEAQRTTASAHGAQDLRCAPRQCPDPQAENVYVLGAPKLKSADLDRKTVHADIDPGSRGPVVLFRFTKQGQKHFQELTQSLAERGRRMNRPQHVLVVIDERVYASPSIDFRRFPHGIPGGAGVQLNVASMAEATKLAKALRG